MKKHISSTYNCPAVKFTPLFNRNFTFAALSGVSEIDFARIQRFDHKIFRGSYRIEGKYDQA